MYGNREVRKTAVDFYSFEQFITSQDLNFYSVEFLYRYKQHVIHCLERLVDQEIKIETWPKEIRSRIFFDVYDSHLDPKDPISREVVYAVDMVYKKLQDAFNIYIGGLVTNKNAAIYIQVIVTANLNLTVIVSTEETRDD